jgi:hypothetical protein
MSESLNERDEMESEVAEKARRRYHRRGLDQLTDKHTPSGVHIFRFATLRSFVPEQVIEEIAKRAGLANAGEVRLRAVTSSYWDEGRSRKQSVHHFTWAL